MPNDVTLDYSIDCVLRKLNLTSDYLVDSVIMGKISLQYLIDLKVVKISTMSYSIDTELVHSKSYLIDLPIQVSRPSTYSIDTLLKAIGVSSTCSIDVKIAKINSLSYSVDTRLIGSRATYSIDTILRKTGTSTYNTDAIVKKITSSSYSIDVQIQGAITLGYSVDCILYEAVPKFYWARGHQAKIKLNGIEIGHATEATVKIEKEMEEYYSVENPIVRLVEGSRKITGTIRRAWVNTYYLRLLGISETGFSWDNSQEFDLEFRARRDILNPQTIHLYNCRFTKASINIPQSGWLEEEYDFIAKKVIAGFIFEPSGCPASGEYITNGEFGNELNYWDHSEDVYVDWEYGEQGYNYYVVLPYSYQYIRQNIEEIKGTSIPVECISSFKFRAKQLSCPPVILGITITYSDSTTSYIECFVYSFSWVEYDLLSYVTSGKSISKIEFQTQNYPVGIDSISLVV